MRAKHNRSRFKKQSQASRLTFTVRVWISQCSRRSLRLLAWVAEGLPRRCSSESNRDWNISRSSITNEIPESKYQLLIVYLDYFTNDRINAEICTESWSSRTCGWSAEALKSRWGGLSRILTVTVTVRKCHGVTMLSRVFLSFRHCTTYLCLYFIPRKCDELIQLLLPSELKH